MNYADFTALFADARNEMAYVADIDTHEMIFMTKAAMELAGIASEKEYRNKKCHEILQGLNDPCSFCSNPKLLAGQSPYVWEQYNPVVERWLRLENYYFELDGRRCRGEWATDISDEHDTISDLQNQLEREKILMKSIRTLALEPDAHTAVNLFLQYIGTYYRADRACIFETDYVHRVVNNTYEWCAEGISSQMAHFQNAPLDVIEDWVENFQDDASHQIATARDKEEKAIDGVLSSRGVANLMIVPLRKENALVGFLGVDNARAHARDTTLLALSANFITEEFQKRQLVWDLGSREYTDRLTGLYNRSKYLQTLDEYRWHPPKSLAVFFLDLNGLKELNEQSGHDAGDRFICQCADTLRGLGLNAFRIDGDEFVIFRQDVSQADAIKMEKRIRTALQKLKPNTVSMGFAWGEGRVDAMSLVTEADELMYADKQIYYRETLSQDRNYRTGMATDVLREIREGKFVVYFQPQVKLKTGEIYGAEALVRKRNETGIVTPDRFIPLYEAEGVISHVDFHVLEQVCAQMKAWQERFGKCPKISVNFSRLTLMEPNVVSRIYGICRNYGIRPGQLTIEVTESTGKLSQEQLHNLVSSLQEAGFSVSLDDFGSRYSNLSILTSIDFQLIKLDKSLIDRIGMEEKCTKIVRNLLYLCRDTISTPSLAEGVETLEQVNILRDFSCDYAQGYYFSRPVPTEDFTALLGA